MCPSLREPLDEPISTVPLSCTRTVETQGLPWHRYHRSQAEILHCARTALNDQPGVQVWFSRYGCVDKNTLDHLGLPPEERLVIIAVEQHTTIITQRTSVSWGRVLTSILHVLFHHSPVPACDQQRLRIGLQINALYLARKRMIDSSDFFKCKMLMKIPPFEHIHLPMKK